MRTKDDEQGLISFNDITIISRNGNKLQSHDLRKICNKALTKVANRLFAITGYRLDKDDTKNLLESIGRNSI